MTHAVIACNTSKPEPFFHVFLSPQAFAMQMRIFKGNQPIKCKCVWQISTVSGSPYKHQDIIPARDLKMHVKEGLDQDPALMQGLGPIAVSGTQWG